MTGLATWPFLHKYVRVAVRKRLDAAELDRSAGGVEVRRVAAEAWPHASAGDLEDAILGSASRLTFRLVNEPRYRSRRPDGMHDDRARPGAAPDRWRIYIVWEME